MVRAFVILCCCLWGSVMVAHYSGCAFFQGAQKVVCPYVTDIAQAAQLLCSLQADSTASSLQLSQARQQLGAAYNNLQASAAASLLQRQQLEKARGQVQPAPGK